MPTGYTCDVADGKVTEFKEFASVCAHAFGALIHLRGDRPSKEIGDLPPMSDYHAKALDAAKEKLRTLEAMTAEQLQDECDRMHAEAVAERIQWGKENETKRERYNAMLLKVLSWTPPTPEHVGMKEFMVEQLRTSINHDCHTYDTPKPTTPAAMLARARKDVEYHTTEQAKEVERHASRAEWVRKLKESL